jgi:hypothetical protein
MKKLLLILLVCFSIEASAQLTLSEKSQLAQTESFRQRIYQALFSKANFYIGQPEVNPQASVTTTNNLARQKQKAFAVALSKGQVSIDLKVATHFWLANYNSVPQLDSNNQPTDSQILNTAALDAVFDSYAGVISGDTSRAPL